MRYNLNICKLQKFFLKCYFLNKVLLVCLILFKCNGDSTKAVELAQHFHQLAIGANSGFLSSHDERKNVNRKIHQRHSLNVNSYYQMPGTARGSISYDRVPVR